MGNKLSPVENRAGISSFGLHILAMAFMLMDHMWATVVPDNMWLTCVGRLAFPIFAFMIVEGYYHTGSVKKYMLRLLVFALISEVPFNLMVSGSVLYPFHQNVMWTLLLGLITVYFIGKLTEGCLCAMRILGAIMVVIAAFLLGSALMLDYYGYGVLTVVTFYLFRGSRWYLRLGQLVGLWIINFEMIGGLEMPLSLGGMSFDFPQQGFAVLALIFIWMYNGTQGPHGKAVKYAFYAFYPLHMLILALIALV